MQTRLWLMRDEIVAWCQKNAYLALILFSISAPILSFAGTYIYLDTRHNTHRMFPLEEHQVRRIFTAIGAAIISRS